MTSALEVNFNNMRYINLHFTLLYFTLHEKIKMCMWAVIKYLHLRRTFEKLQSVCFRSRFGSPKYGIVTYCAVGVDNSGANFNFDVEYMLYAGSVIRLSVCDFVLIIKPFYDDDDDFVVSKAGEKIQKYLRF